MILTSNDIVVFTDGSSRGNPGPGGFAAVVVYKLKVESWEVKEIGGREEKTTNNRMELTAAIKALEFVSSLHATRCTLYADSSYLINGITKWIYGWQKNGWKTKERRDVENRDLWEALISAVRGKSIEWKQVGGHVGVAGNVRCDEIATAFADGHSPKLYADVLDLPAAPSGSAAQAGNYPIKNILDIKEDAELAAEKASGRSHSNAKAYSYVSLVDGVIQTHKTWSECEARVKGKKAKFKKALSAEEEKNLITEWAKR
jgi:ribonuclease HI